MRRFFLVFLLTAGLLAGCGFQLRGAITLPDSIKSVYIISPDTRLRDNIADSLRSNQITVVNEAAAGSAVIEVFDANFQREISTLDERGKATGYVLIYNASFEVRDSAGETLVPRARTAARRDYSFNPDQLLSAEREEELLRDEMRDEATYAILRKMSRIR